MLARAVSIVATGIIVLTIFIESQSQIISITGKVEDSISGKPIDEVIIQAQKKSVTTDESGYFSFSVEKGDIKMLLSRLGYAPLSLSINLFRDTTLLVRLNPSKNELNEVVVKSTRLEKDFELRQTSVNVLDQADLLRIPALAGEKDIIKALSLLPGVMTGSEGSSDLFVRGGGTDQNLILLDNTPVYSSQHLFGFLSTFNPLIVNHATIYKGGFPARFSGRLSSVIDIQTENPNLDSISGVVEIGIISSKLKIDLPLISNRVGLVIAARRTYADGLVALRNKISGQSNRNGINFHDIDLKLHFNNKNFSGSLTHHADQDNYYLIYDNKNEARYTESRLNWRNRITSFNAELKSGKWHNHFGVGFSYYRLNQFYSEENNTIIQEQVNQTSEINDVTVKYMADISVTRQFDLRWGIQSINYFFNPSQLNYTSSDTAINKITIPQSKAFNPGVFLDNKLNFDKLELSLGLRYNFYLTDDLKFSYFEPRLNSFYKISDQASLTFSYARMYQPLHQLTNPGIGLPYNVWVNSTAKIVPERSDVVAINYTHSRLIGKQSLVFSVEPYIKRLNNVISFKDGYSTNTFASTFLQPELWADVLTVGNGVSYGVEVLVEKKSGNLTGWLSYAYGRVKMNYPELNNGKRFNGLQDIPNQFSVFGSYRLNQKWSLNTTWVFNTGRPITLSTGAFSGPLFDYSRNSFNTSTSFYQMQIPTERNSLRMKNYHRLDINLTKKIKLFKKFDGSLDFGLYNIYNRRNSFYYYLKPENDNVGNTRIALKSVSVFPILPQFSLSIKF